MVEPTDNSQPDTEQAVEQEPKPRLYGWPENDTVRACQSANTLEQWLIKCEACEDVIGKVANELVELGLSNEIPPHEEIERLIRHPWIKEATLRLGNEIFTSVTGKGIEEPNRALVLLGARAMRDIALCAALTERALVQPMPEVMLPEIVRSYLSGVFSLLIARKKYQIANTSHLLTAGYLSRLGYWYLWLFGGEKAKALWAKKNQEKGFVSVEHQRQIFGFSADQLTLSLARQWHLNSSLITYLTGGASVQSEDYTVTLGARLSDSLFDGPKGLSFIDCKREVHHYLGCSADELQDLILEGLERTVEGLSVFDNHDLLDHIPFPKEEASPLRSKTQDINHDLPIDMDMSKVKTTLKTIAAMPLQSEDVQELFTHCAQGLLEGGDFDRVVIALLDPSGHHVHSKIIRQIPSDALKDRFGLELDDDLILNDLHFNLMEPEGYLIRNIMRENKTAWVRSTDSVFKKLRKRPFNEKMGWGQFFIAPVAIKSRRLGFYYCDRQVTHRKLDMKSYDVFTDLCEQTNKSLAYIKDNETI